MTNHDRILVALEAWIAQRPGLDPRDYGDRAGYQSESRRVTRQRHDAERLLAEVGRTGPHSDEAWADAFRAYSGRLSWDAATGRLDYCTGQYWPTEYRAAVAAVAASLLWARYRDSLPAPDAYRVVADSAWDGNVWRKGQIKSTHATRAHAENDCPIGHSVTEVYGRKRQSAGDYLRAQFVNRFGASFARRWFG